jgi:endonuclease/exonuclease/phosphatase family metal-dependent hydrolase
VEPAVAGLNEVWDRPGDFEQTAGIAGRLGMEYRFAPAHRRGSVRIGNAVLTRGRILESADLTLPKHWEGRVALVARIEVDGVELRFASTHLSLGRDARAEQVEALVLSLPLDLPLVLTGDFNATAAALAPLAGLLTVVEEPPATYPSPWPVRAIDHIAFSAHWELRDLFAVPGVASDHRPLVAELDLVPPAATG